MLGAHSAGGAGDRPDVHTAELADGEVEYLDVGQGPVIVLVHGVWMDGSLWAPVVERLRADFRCVVPDLPLGAHRRPMSADTNLSLRGHAHRLARFLDEVGLEDVTLVFNDWCAAQVLVADGVTSRISRLVLVSCETDDNYPPGLAGRVLALAGGLPGGLFLPAKLFGIRAARRLPFTFGRMSSRPIPHEVMDRWLDPARKSAAIRRDLQRYVGDTRRGKRDLVDATEKLRQFDKPVLVAWGQDDRVMPLASGRRLAEAFPRSTFVEIPDAGTLVPWDQPEALSSLIADFVRAQGGQAL